MKKLYFGLMEFIIFMAVYTTTVFADGYGGEHEKGFEGLAPLLGVITILCLITTFLFGVFMKKKRQILFPWHKRLGILTLISALAHATMIVMFFD